MDPRFRVPVFQQECDDEAEAMADPAEIMIVPAPANMVAALQRSPQSAAWGLRGGGAASCSNTARSVLRN